MYPVRYAKSTGQSECHENITFSQSSGLVIVIGLKVTFAWAVETKRRAGIMRKKIFFISYEKRINMRTEIICPTTKRHKAISIEA